MHWMTCSLLTLALAACFSSSPKPSAAFLTAAAMSSCSVRPLKVSLAALPTFPAISLIGAGASSPAFLPALASTPGEVIFS